MTRIAYHPPKSVSHGHGPRARSPRKAWEATQAFLSQHTTFDLRSPVALTIWGPSQWTDSAVVVATRAEAAEKFGAATSISGEFYNWDLPISQLQDALDFAFEDEKRPKQSLGPVRLYVSYSIAWKAFPNPAQAGNAGHFARGSMLGVSLGGRRLFLQPTFLFEASDQDSLFIAQLRLLEQSMPFVPKDTNYYRVEPKKNGNGEKLVKLRPGWQSAA